MRSNRLARSAARATRHASLAALLLAAPGARGQGVEPGDLLIADRQGLGPARILQVERATGALRTLYASYDGVLIAPRDLEIDGTGRIFASQSAIPTRPAPESVVRVDAATGVATILSQGALLRDVDGIGLAADGALLAADHGTAFGVAPAIVRIDPETGAQSVVTSGGALLRPIDVVAEGATDLLVLDSGSGAGAQLVRVNVATGAQSVLVAPGALGNAAGGFARDVDGSLLVASAFGELFRVTAAGAVAPVGGAPGLPTLDVALEPDGDALLLAGGAADRLDRVDRTTATATTLATGLGTPQGIAVAPAVTPFCDVEVDRPAYADGQIVRVTTLRFANPTTATFSTRLRLQMRVPTLPAPIDMVTFTTVLPARFDAELAAFNVILVQSSLPRGNYELRCAFEDPATSAVQYENRVPFGFQ